MKKTSNKIIEGSMIVMLIATIGAVFASANIDDTKDIDASQNMFCDRRQPDGLMPFGYNLTDDQKTELKDLINNLKEQGANSSEVRAAIQQKLDEGGVFDQQLDNDITQTKQRLQILNKEKELRDQGYNWYEIRIKIQNEFGLQGFNFDDHDIMNKPGHGQEPFKGTCDFKFGEESN